LVLSLRLSRSGKRDWSNDGEGKRGEGLSHYGRGKGKKERHLISLSRGNSLAGKKKKKSVASLFTEGKFGLSFRRRRKGKKKGGRRGEDEISNLSFDK